MNAMQVEMPQNLESERAVLGSMIMAPAIIPAIVTRIEREDFFLRSHQHIYEAIIVLSDRNRVTLAHVGDYLRRNKLLDDAGGPVYLANLEQGVMSTYAAPEHAELIKEKSRFRKLIAVSNQMLNGAVEEVDFQAIIDHGFDALLGLVSERASERLLTSEAAASLAAADASERVNRHRSGQQYGFATGISDIDRLLGGFEPGELVYLAAFPGMGKTAFALNVFEHLTRKLAQPAVFYSLEMGIHSIMHRHAASLSRVSGRKVRRGTCGDFELRKIREAYTELGKGRGYYCDCGDLNVSQLAAEVKLLKIKEPGLTAVFIDGLWLMDHGAGANTALSQAIANTSRKLKLMAKDMGIVLFVLHQFRKPSGEGKEPRPTLHLLRDSGGPVQDADWILGLSRDREERTAQAMETNPGAVDVTEFIVLKSRNDSTGSVEVSFQGEYQRFSNLAKSEEVF